MYRIYIFEEFKKLVVFAYRSLRNTSKDTFFDKLSISLNQITNAYANFIVTGDLNIDTLDESMNTNSYLSDFCNTYSLKNLILGKNCFEAASGTSVDAMFTYRPERFQKNSHY